MGALSADLVHTLVEAKKLAFADRERWSGDPRFLDAPLGELLSPSHLARRARGDRPEAGRDGGRGRRPPPGDTTYFCVVDGEGNAVSGIQSLNSAFGSGVTAGDTGILLNNRMTPWHLEPGHPNRLAPGKRVRHTMNPPMVFRDGELWAVLGTPGGDYQVQVNLQVLTAMIDFGYDPQQAAEMPRWSAPSRVRRRTGPTTARTRSTWKRGSRKMSSAELAAPRPPGRPARRPRRPLLRRDHPPGRRHRHAPGRLRSSARRLGAGVLTGRGVLADRPESQP